jgi:hypothetical protein
MNGLVDVLGRYLSFIGRLNEGTKDLPMRRLEFQG